MLTFRPNFHKDKEHVFSAAQKYIDSEVLRLSDQYVPMQTGMLKKSGTLGTVIGSGEVRYNATYSRQQYYSGRAPGTSKKGPLRGRMWFERMKADHKDEIINGAKKIAGGK